MFFFKACGCLSWLPDNLISNKCWSQQITMMMTFTHITDLPLLARELNSDKWVRTHASNYADPNWPKVKHPQLCVYACAHVNVCVWGGGGADIWCHFCCLLLFFKTWCMKCTGLGLIWDRVLYDNASSIIKRDFFPHFLTGAMWHHKPEQQRSSVLQSCLQAAHRSLRA